MENILSLDLYFIFHFFTIGLFLKNLYGSNSKVKKVKKRSINSKLENLSIYAICWCKYPFDTHGVAKYGFISTFYFLVCLSRAIFKDFIGGHTRMSKKVKKKSINLKLENLPMDALFHYR